MTMKPEETVKVTLENEAFYGTERFIELLFSLNKEKYNISEKETAQWIKICVNVFEKGVKND